MTGTYDVNARRQARRSSSPALWHFRLDGVVYDLPTELSRDQARAISALSDSDSEGLLRILLGPTQYKAFEAVAYITMQDIAGILEAYGKATGFGVA